MIPRRGILHPAFAYSNEASHSDVALFRARMRERRDKAQASKAKARTMRAVEPAGELADVTRIGRKL